MYSCWVLGCYLEGLSSFSRWHLTIQEVSAGLICSEETSYCASGAGIYSACHKVIVALVEEIREAARISSSLVPQLSKISAREL